MKLAWFLFLNEFFFTGGAVHEAEQTERTESGALDIEDVQETQQTADTETTDKSQAKLTILQQLDQTTHKVNTLLHSLMSYMIPGQVDGNKSDLQCFVKFFEKSLPQFHSLLFSQVSHIWRDFLAFELDALENVGLMKHFITWLYGFREHFVEDGSLDSDALILWKHLIRCGTASAGPNESKSAQSRDQLWSAFQHIQRFRQHLLSRVIIWVTESVPDLKKRQKSSHTTEQRQIVTGFGEHCHRVWFPSYYESPDEDDDSNIPLFRRELLSKWGNVHQESSSRLPDTETMIQELQLILVAHSAPEFLVQLRLLLETFHKDSLTPTSRDLLGTHVPYLHDRSLDLAQGVVTECQTLYQEHLKALFSTTLTTSHSEILHIENMVELLLRTDPNYFIQCTLQATYGKAKT